MDPIGIILWIVIGGIAGFLAEKVMKTNQSLLMNVVFGILGAILLNFLLMLIGVSLGGLIGQLIVAFLGACLLIFLIRLVRRA